MKGFDHLAYKWLAQYRDGTTICQFDPNGKEHLFSEIDQSKLKRIGWISIDNTSKSYSIDLKEGQKPIIFRKNILSMISGEHKFVFVLGIEGQTPVYIFQDEVVITQEV